MLTHTDYKSPQAIQGMWQGYGQIRAARVLGRATLLATGLVGSGLWFYQQQLNTQKEQLENQENVLNIKNEQLKNLEKEIETRNTTLDERSINLERLADIQTLSIFQKEVIERFIGGQNVEEIRKDLDEALNKPKNREGEEYKVMLHSYQHGIECKGFFNKFGVELNHSVIEQNTPGMHP